MLDGVGWNLFQRKFFIQHFLASSTEYTCWTRLKWFTVYSNVFIKNKNFSTSMTIVAKKKQTLQRGVPLRHIWKARRNKKKLKWFRKWLTIKWLKERKPHKSKASKGKGGKDWKDDEVFMLIELLEERPSLWNVFIKD